MPGEIIEDKVIISDEKEGNRIYNKGYFGKPLSGGGVELNLYEAVYLVEADRLEVKEPNGKIVPKKILFEKALSKDERASIKYPVYKDMRLRGYVIKDISDPADFRIFPRGGGPGKTPSKYWLLANLETETFNIEQIEKIYDKINNIKKKMIIGLVDLEGDVTYYQISTIDLKGKVEEYKGDKLEGVLYDNKCLIEENGKILHKGFYYGNISDSTIDISLIEALYLLETGSLEIKKSVNGNYISVNELKSIGMKKDDNFKLKYDIYKDLRNRNIIPKTGFKYGTAFRCYAGDPDKYHAEYMIQPVKNDFTTSWYNISKSVRVAHSVKKTFLYARDKKEEPRYFKITRLTP